MSLRLLMLVLVYSVFIVIFYISESKKQILKLNNIQKQIVSGVLFGILIVISSTSWGGIPLENEIIDFASGLVICAGFVYGSLAAIISAVIGALHKYIIAIVYNVGISSSAACIVSVIIAGLVASALRKFVLDNKRPSWMYAVIITLSVEVFHLLLVFLFNMKNVSEAFATVRRCAIPILIANAMVVGLVLLGVNFADGKRSDHYRKRTISTVFQRWLFLCIIVAFVMTDVFTTTIETDMYENQVKSQITTNINDVYQDIKDASDENLLNVTIRIKDDYIEGEDINVLAEKYNVSEINIINKDGFIIKTNNSQYLGYDMASGEQSAEFLTLLNGEKEQFVQDYRPTSYDNKTYRKYGAVVLEDGGFLQVGYDASQFRGDINDFVGKITKNRHLGTKGFIVICDEQRNMVTEGRKNSGKNLKMLDNIDIKEKKLVEGKVFETAIDGVDYLCTHRFVEGYYIIGVMPKDEAMFTKNVSDYISTLTELSIFAILFILICFLIKRVVIDNINRVNNSLAGITAGDLSVVVDVHSNEEFTSLSNDINSTVDTLKNYISEAEARIDEELEFARQIQSSSLPTVFPKRRDFKIFANMITAKEVGGDFYDFYMLNDTTVLFLVADVSGKGIPAAMFMMKAKAILKGLAESGLEPDEIFTKANDNLCENNEAGMFVTAWMGILDLKTGIMKYTNAGHNPPLILRENGKFDYLKVRSGLVLAGMEGIKYRKNELQLMPGDKIFLYTDGVTEATNANNELYGEERLEAIINSVGDVTPEVLCAMVKEDVDKFVGDAPQFDDITMLSLDVNCLFGSHAISVIPNKESLEIVKDFANNLTSKLEIIPKTASKINIIFDEIYTNIVNYSGASYTKISHAIEGKELFITFIDNGVAYNPLSAEAPDITLSAEERQIGGLGIHMVKKMTGNIEYARENDENILKLTVSLI